MREMIVRADGSRHWYENGKLSELQRVRIAQLRAQGSREWYENGVLIRSEPACPLRAERLRIERDITQ